jgi:Integrase core domain
MPLQIATWRRRPGSGTVVHSTRIAVHVPDLRAPAPRRPPARIHGPRRASVDNSMIESFWSTMQRKVLDTAISQSPAQLGAAIFEWIEAWYNSRRRHTSLAMLMPIDYEQHWRHENATAASRRRPESGMITTPPVSENRVRLPPGFNSERKHQTSGAQDGRWQTAGGTREAVQR